jgi:hypothetical protein
MSKIKWLLIATAVITAIGGAFATRVRTFCETQQQYYKFGSSYIPVSGYGQNYQCLNTAGICTYYLVDPFTQSYAPCRTGSFSFIY